MLREETMPQFQNFLLELSCFAQLGCLSIEDTRICALHSTATKFNTRKETVQDMLTRRSKVKGIVLLDKALEELFKGDSTRFKGMYYQHVPKSYHIAIDAICNKIILSKFDLPKQSCQDAKSLLKQFAEGTAAERRNLIAMLETAQKK